MSRIRSILATAVMFICCSLHGRAALYTIEVMDFEFVQDFDSLLVGDTVQWVLVNGIHTTTSNGVPSGAEMWNVVLNPLNTSFTYVVRIAGTYNYISVPNAPLMGGSFEASWPVGLLDPYPSITSFEIVNRPGSQVDLLYELATSAEVSVTWWYLTGIRAGMTEPRFLPVGTYRETLDVSALPSGMFIILLRAGNFEIPGKFILR